MTKQELQNYLRDIELANSVGMATNRHIKNLIRDIKRKVNLCIEDGCMKEVEDGDERCEEHWLEKLIDSKDETTSPFFCDDSAQL